MAQSFFHLAPDNDPLPAPSREPISYCELGDCDAYSEAEHDAIMQEAQGLSDAFFEALDAYGDTHPGLSYAIIFHAVDCLAFCLRQQMAEDTADA